MNKKENDLFKLLEITSNKDWVQLKRDFTRDEIIDAILQHPGMEAKTRNFLSLYYNVPKYLIRANGLIAVLEETYETGEVKVQYEKL